MCTHFQLLSIKKNNKKNSFSWKFQFPVTFLVTCRTAQTQLRVTLFGSWTLMDVMCECERLDSCSGFCLCAGWYWGAVTAAQAHAALQEACEGAFLVRDSSHPMYMLTLSVRTARGPTSIRIQYSGAQFLLDSSSPARPSLSSFPSVPSLVQHYMGQEKKAEEGKMEVEAPSKPSQQTIQETSVVLKLKRAVYKPTGLPSLQHLTRLVINTHCDCADQLPLPRPLLRFIQDYPFKVWGVGPDLQSRDLGAANSETNNGQSRWPEPDGWRVTVGPRRKNWTQGQTFFTEVICTISGETDVSDVGLSLWRTEGWSVPQRGGRGGESQYCTLHSFCGGCGNCLFVFYSPQFKVNILFPGHRFLWTHRFILSHIFYILQMFIFFY